jgi:hypothetical protein
VLGAAETGATRTPIMERADNLDDMSGGAVTVRSIDRDRCHSARAASFFGRAAAACSETSFFLRYLDGAVDVPGRESKDGNLRHRRVSSATKPKSRPR